MSRERRPGEVGTHHMGDYAQWARERLAIEPDAVTHPDLARQDYLMWCSDRFAKPHPRSKARATIKGIGGTVKGTKDATRYHGVRLLPLGGETQPPEAVIAALRALRDAGMVADRAILNRAYVDLTESRLREED